MSDLASDPFAAAAAGAEELRRRLRRSHHVAVVLGSGWGAAADLLAQRADDDVVTVPLADVPAFPLPRVTTHRPEAVSLQLGGRGVLILAGRVHLYEGWDVAAVAHGVRTAAALGCTAVVLTNAAGSIDPTVAVGTPVLVADHINLTGHNPLVGVPDVPDRTRFVDCSSLYDPTWRARVRAGDATLREAVYAGLLGPSFETPAEIRMLRTVGADLVGMSTVVEAIAAAHLGLRVLGVSLVTNPAAGTTAAPVSASEVFAAARAAVPHLSGLLAAAIDTAPVPDDGAVSRPG